MKYTKGPFKRARLSWRLARGYQASRRTALRIIIRNLFSR